MSLDTRNLQFGHTYGRHTDETGKYIMPTAEVVRHKFYNDLDDAEAEAWCASLRRRTITPSFIDKCRYAAWRHVPVTYLYCEKDEAISIAVQHMMVEKSGVHFDAESIDSGHSPFLSRPVEFAPAIRRLARRSRRYSSIWAGVEIIRVLI